MTVTAAAQASLEGLLNWAIRKDPEAFTHLDDAHGKIICIELIGLGQRLYLIPSPSGIQLLGDCEGEADCTIRGTPWSLARMGGEQGDSSQLFTGDVEISGDTQLAHHFSCFMNRLEIDWEEQLSKLTGDVIAHEVGNLVRGLSEWGRDQLTTSRLNLQEYLTEELRLLPTRCEVEEFLSDVDVLRDDLDRLDARIGLLRQQAGATS
ncbi:MAG: SCP2 sterol-binding domain-containing protein [Candidatus Polarisedimenticolaceae bacterium]|nr:SCP2 sterol-binding domain-containing protein [Candidatus Polarisedimenticolaceae bacterium]